MCSRRVVNRSRQRAYFDLGLQLSLLGPCQHICARRYRMPLSSQWRWSPWTHPVQWLFGRGCAVSRSCLCSRVLPGNQLACQSFKNASEQSSRRARMIHDRMLQLWLSNPMHRYFDGSSDDLLLFYNYHLEIGFSEVCRERLVVPNVLNEFKEFVLYAGAQFKYFHWDSVWAWCFVLLQSWQSKVEFFTREKCVFRCTIIGGEFFEGWTILFFFGTHKFWLEKPLPSWGCICWDFRRWPASSVVIFAGGGLGLSDSLLTILNMLLMSPLSFAFSISTTHPSTQFL